MAYSTMAAIKWIDILILRQRPFLSGRKAKHSNSQLILKYLLIVDLANTFIRSLIKS